MNLRPPTFLATVAAVLALSLQATAAPPIPAEMVRLRVESADHSPSKHTLEVALRAEIAEGWHVNAHEPTLETLVPTTLTVEPPTGFEVGAIRYPEAHQATLGFAPGKPLRVYSGAAVFLISITGRAKLAEGGVNFVARLNYQACDDTRCLRPAEVERTFLVKGPAAEPEKIADRNTTAALPVGRWIDERGWLPALLLVALMGLALNLTPCVYPLVSITVAYFGGQARERRGRAILLSSVYVLGIALTFSALGVSAALSGALFGRALQHPAMLIGIAALMIALAASSFGLYSLQPPAGLLQRVGGASAGVSGALFMGLTMGVVAAPCVGPIIAGLLIAVGARGDAGFGFLMFFTLALGLGAPYVVLGAAAGSISRLPRSGEWLRWVEHLFGFVLLGLALYFVRPLLGPAVASLMTALLLGAAGIILGFLDPAVARGGLLSRAQQAVGALGMLSAVWVAVPAGPHGEAIRWQPFSSAALEAARTDHRPVVVDFRADWCLPCVEMERTTFVAPEVLARTRGVVMLRADVTETSPASEALLSRYQVLGVPTTVFYGHDGEESERRIGYVAASEFVELLEKIAVGSSGTEQARDS